MSAGGENRRGSRKGASKLTTAKVLDIRRRHIPGQNTSALAREFGINKRNLLGIVNGETWGWLEEEAA